MANESTREVLSARSGVGLGNRTTGEILKVRNGKDGKAGTRDDTPFLTLAALDAVPWVGPTALAKLVTYAQSHGFVPEAPPPSPNKLVARADRTPWSGYWWSMQNGELVRGWSSPSGREAWTESEVRAFDACPAQYTATCQEMMDGLLADGGRSISPLMKFDLWVRRWLEAEHGPGNAGWTLYTHAARWELDHHYIGDDPDHPHADSAGPLQQVVRPSHRAARQGAAAGDRRGLTLLRTHEHRRCRRGHHYATSAV